MGKMYRRWDKFEVQDVIARYLSGEDVTVNTSTIVGGGNTGPSITYAPQITFAGSTTQEVRDEFGKMLKQHANEIMELIRKQAIAEEYGRSVRSIEMMIYRQGLHRRVKSPVNDRAKLDCMPDPFEWMGGKDHL